MQLIVPFKYCAPGSFQVKKEKRPFEKPWAIPPPPLYRSHEEEVFYPTDVEDTGVVRIGWRGPSLPDNIKE